jgi:hypothetical protein
MPDGGRALPPAAVGQQSHPGLAPPSASGGPGPGTCPEHGTTLVEGFVGQLVEIVGVSTTTRQIPALFCLAAGCRYKSVLGGKE